MSEAEFERLYQEFIRKGGGALTSTNTPTSDSAILESLGEAVNTPVSYYDQSNNIGLDPSTLADLNATEEQFNRQKALGIISSEIASNNFSNPYLSVASNGIANYTTYSAHPGVSALSDTNSVFNLLSDTNLGGSSLTKSTILAAVLSNTGVKFDDILKGAIIGGLAIDMFNSLKSHTENQILDLPQTLEDADTLAGLNAQFGERDTSCSLFNELMGIMSGAFDGAFDLLNNAGNSIMNILEGTGILGFFDTVKNGLSGIINGLVGGISDNISNIVSGLSSIVNSALGGLGATLGTLGGLASGALNAISSITNQIAGEIAGLSNMMDQITSKLKSIAMAGAMLDPCKLAVLLNTGSDELKSAANLLNAPLAVPTPRFVIPTETDPRANKNAVNMRMAEAKDKASKGSGVPQSPFSSLAGIYQPINAYLFDLFDDLSGIFTSNFETVIGSDGQTKIVEKPVTGSNSVSANNSIIERLRQDLPSRLEVPELESPPSIDTLSGLDRGSLNQNALSDLAASLNDAMNPAISSATRLAKIIDTDLSIPSFDNKDRQLIPITVNSGAVKSWRNEIFPRMMEIRSDAQVTYKEIQRYLDQAKFRDESQKRQSRIIEENLMNLEREARSLRNRVEEMRYTTPGGDLDSAKEQELKVLYRDDIYPKQDKILKSLRLKVDNEIRSWNSIKAQAIYNGE